MFLFCRADQVAVRELVPLAFPGSSNFGGFQECPERNRDALIEQDPHAANVDAVNSRTLST
jgi:hypothetical protein